MAFSSACQLTIASSLWPRQSYTTDYECECETNLCLLSAGFQEKPLGIIIRPAYPVASSGIINPATVDEDSESDDDDGVPAHDGTLLASGPARPL